MRKNICKLWLWLKKEKISQQSENKRKQVPEKELHKLQSQHAIDAYETFVVNAKHVSRSQKRYHWLAEVFFLLNINCMV